MLDVKGLLPRKSWGAALTANELPRPSVHVKWGPGQHQRHAWVSSTRTLDGHFPSQRRTFAEVPATARLTFTICDQIKPHQANAQVRAAAV